MTKIINIKTGVERTIKPPKPALCEVCDTDIGKTYGGVKGVIGKLPVAFCGVCITGIVAILVENNIDKDS